jgi:hypothetical protein
MYLLSFGVWVLCGLAAYVGLIPWAVATLIALPVSWALGRLARMKRGDPAEDARISDVGVNE